MNWPLSAGKRLRAIFVLKAGYLDNAKRRLLITDRSDSLVLEGLSDCARQSEALIVPEPLLTAADDRKL